MYVTGFATIKKQNPLLPFIRSIRGGGRREGICDVNSIRCLLEVITITCSVQINSFNFVFFYLLDHFKKILNNIFEFLTLLLNLGNFSVILRSKPKFFFNGNYIV